MRLVVTSYKGCTNSVFWAVAALIPYITTVFLVIQGYLFQTQATMIPHVRTVVLVIHWLSLSQATMIPAVRTLVCVIHWLSISQATFIPHVRTVVLVIHWFSTSDPSSTCLMGFFPLNTKYCVMCGYCLHWVRAY